MSWRSVKRIMMKSRIPRCTSALWCTGVKDCSSLLKLFWLSLARHFLIKCLFSGREISVGQSPSHGVQTTRSKISPRHHVILESETRQVMKTWATFSLQVRCDVKMTLMTTTLLFYFKHLCSFYPALNATVAVQRLKARPTHPDVNQSTSVVNQVLNPEPVSSQPGETLVSDTIF